MLGWPAGWTATRIEPNTIHAQNDSDSLRCVLPLRHSAPLLGVIDGMVPTKPARVTSRLDVGAVMEVLWLAG